MSLPAEPRLIRALGDSVFLVASGSPGDGRHCVVAESPAGLILFDPPHDAVETLIAAFSTKGWLFSDLLAMLVTEPTPQGMSGAIRIGIRNRRCRIMAPRLTGSPRYVRALRRFLDDVESDDQIEAALDRAEVVLPFETLGPGGRVIEVVPASDNRSVVYQDAAAGIAVAGTVYQMPTGISPGLDYTTDHIRALLELLIKRDVRLLVGPGIEPCAPADLLARLESGVDPDGDPPIDVAQKDEPSIDAGTQESRT